MKKRRLFQLTLLLIMTCMLSCMFSRDKLNKYTLSLEATKTASGIQDDDDLIKQMEERLKEIEDAAKKKEDEPKVLCNDKDALNYGSTTEACKYKEETKPEEPKVLCNDKNALNYGSTTEACKYPEIKCKDKNAINYLSTTEECKYEEKKPEETTPQICNSKIWVYNNADEELTIIINNEAKEVRPGNYIESEGTCNEKYTVKASNEYTMGNKQCSVDFTRNAAYPKTNDAVENIEITATCVNNGKNYFEIDPFTPSQIEAAGLDYVYNPEAYIYGLEITATYNGYPLEDITFIAVDEDGYIIKGANDKIASVQTNAKGKAYMYLYTGNSYTIKQQLDEEYDKYDARNGEINLDLSRTSIRKAEGFKESDIIEYGNLNFLMGLSDLEMQTMKKVENESLRLLDWGNRIKAEIESEYDKLNKNKYNSKQLQELEYIRDRELENLMSVMKEYNSGIEKNIREGNTPTYTYDLDSYKIKLKEIDSHWQHWIILAVFAFTFILQTLGLHIIPFIIALISGITLKYDLCLYGGIFYGASVLINLIMLVRSFIDPESKARRREFLWKLANLNNQ